MTELMFWGRYLEMLWLYKTDIETVWKNAVDYEVGYVITRKKTWKGEDRRLEVAQDCKPS
jgi:hypothetical protein